MDMTKSENDPPSHSAQLRCDQIPFLPLSASSVRLIVNLFLTDFFSKLANFSRRTRSHHRPGPTL